MPDGQLSTPLTYAALDGLAFAALHGRPIRGTAFASAELGPLIEMSQLARTGLLPGPLAARWLLLTDTKELLHAAADGISQWVCPRTGSQGVYRCTPDPKRWGTFRLSAHKAALAVAFPTEIVRRLMGAMGEIRDNVIEHSETLDNGLVLFRAQPNSFEFVVADAGIGVLASLKTHGDYSGLRDEGEALECALSEGESRFGRNAGRGTGFSQLFKSLASLNSFLRFRSGDHALSIAGRNPTLVNAHIAKKPHASGFMCAVHCRAQM